MLLVREAPPASGARGLAINGFPCCAVASARRETMEEAKKTAGGIPTLFLLCGRAVSANMETLEQEVWALPSTILQHLLPLLNIYYLERIEEAAVRKGLSTEPVWCQIWKQVMKRKPSRYENIKCWRQKFLETFFHNIMRGILDVSSDARLNDPRFSPLQYSSRYVTELTIGNKLQGVTRLGAVLRSLAGSVQTLKFLHLRSADTATEHALELLLHCLIHHGKVCKISLSSWPTPDKDLLALILHLSAGLWHPGSRLCQSAPCFMCLQEPRAERACPAKESGQPQYLELLGSSRVQVPTGADTRNALINGKPPSALLNLNLLDVDQGEPAEVSANGKADAGAGDVSGLPSSVGNAAGSGMCHRPPPPSKVPPPPSSRDPDAAAGSSLNCSSCQGGDAEAEQDELFDFVFSVAREKTTESQDGSSGGAETCTGGRGVLPGAVPLRFRSVTSLNLHNVVLTLESCRVLCQLLRSWVSLEVLMMAYNELGPNVFHVLEALCALAQQQDCRLCVVQLSDFVVQVPPLDLARTILTAFPSLHVLALKFNVENYTEEEGPDGSVAEFLANQLKQLEIQFPRGLLQPKCLLSLLRASTCLEKLILDSATFPSPGDLRIVLRALAELHPTLKKLYLHELNLSGCKREVLLLLHNSFFEEVTFSFCQLFERRLDGFLIELIDTVKKNPTLTVLNLRGNRLGDEGLISLADIFSEDSVSSIQHLDVSSNCIKPAGLLQFAKKLETVTERAGHLSLTQLNLSQNLLNRDPATTQEALHGLRQACTVIDHSWDFSQVFADHVSVM
ncbi:leucine-rich repeat-containing protein 41 [Rhinatrema bivittatum]|uniref:leucine-rich repeat-containing protein 41 n=1 Tax=Rhinatrema bivittatum TaxID=194408 RepID=UPI00112CFD43|nr:leucine-rich repeat-containing protein 41 [Rhinatrema bivittatum]